ncbi:MAG: hypothetical protein JJ869_12240 [Marivita sp.]|uniref:DUF4344 domain-containing metallopeptidase n=1 Tax=Marivita sp. TaxID=2003365 RepID=UPI001B0E3519|nr:DUF4344 domain-containing metallopeptidase [Marivita sp.]MBO6884331.1 hypothetical protein [Marivita sp.]
MDYRILSVAVAMAASHVVADEAEDAFVEANILGIFYHELGHALIDVMQMPVFGQEEDAADVASILLIDHLFEPESALAMAYDVANGFWAEAVANAEYPVPYWDTHGPDEQRFYNTVCLFYGGDPDTRDDFAEDMELPEERAEYCVEEYELAADSWGAVFDELAEGGEPMLFTAEVEGSFTAGIIGAEVEALNADFGFPSTVQVITGECDEANAFYDPSDQSIIMCEEFEAHLRLLYGMLQN